MFSVVHICSFWNCIQPQYTLQYGCIHTARLRFLVVSSFEYFVLFFYVVFSHPFLLSFPSFSLSLFLALLSHFVFFAPFSSYYVSLLFPWLMVSSYCFFSCASILFYHYRMFFCFFLTGSIQSGFSFGFARFLLLKSFGLFFSLIRICCASIYSSLILFFFHPSLPSFSRLSKNPQNVHPDWFL